MPEDEVRMCRNIVNTLLKNDESIKDLIPISDDLNEFFTKMANGVILWY